MSKEREALKLALEALEAHADIGIKSDKAITAIKEALAQPEQEPVAFVKGWNCGRLEVIVRSLNQRFEIDQPLYTTPPQRKPLTDEEVRAVIRAGEYDSMEEFARAIETAHGIKGSE